MTESKVAGPQQRSVFESVESAIQNSTSVFPVGIEPVNSPEFGDDSFERDAEELEQKIHASLGAGWDLSLIHI